VVYVPSGATGPEDCTDSSGRPVAYSSRSFEYCGAGQIVYVGQDILWTFYTRTGDAGPAVGLAHEFGHHIQQQVGVLAPRNAEESTRHENQADCVSGAWTRYTDQQGWLEYPDDIRDIEALFPLIGSAEGPERDHGTQQERARSFQRGFDGNVTACSAFYPSAPLVAGR
jgi:predicted metalloprotease